MHILLFINGTHECITRVKFIKGKTTFSAVQTARVI